MEISMTQTVSVQAKTLKINIKIRNGFYAELTDQDEVKLTTYQGYVPDFMPDNRCGEDLRLDIDLDTGQITNWKTPSREDMEEFIAMACEENALIRAAQRSQGEAA